MINNGKKLTKSKYHFDKYRIANNELAAKNNR
jgi:hypothetical protein